MMAHSIASAHRATVLGSDTVVSQSRSVTEQSFQQAEVIDVAVDETSPLTNYLAHAQDLRVECCTLSWKLTM